MTSLNTPILGTPKHAWQFYDLHLTSSYVLDEYFLTSQYVDCVRASELRQSEVGQWARDMRVEGYHKIFTHSFVGMWAAYEAGIENTLVAIIKNSNSAAAGAFPRLKKNKHSLSDWPWTDEICTKIVSNLESSARDSTANGKFDLYATHCTLFGWLGVHLDNAFSLAPDLAEAKLLRNIIMHRYGVIGDSDSKKVPRFATWRNQVMPLDRETFDRYYLAVSGAISAVVLAMPTGGLIANS